MTIVSTAEIAKIFDEIRDQRDAANKRAAAAEARAAQAERAAREWQQAAQSTSARAAQAEAERDGARAVVQRIEDQANKYRLERDDAERSRNYQLRRAESLQATLETINADNDNLRHRLEQAQRRNEFLERRVRELTRQSLSEYETETPLGQQLDGGGDEAES